MGVASAYLVLYNAAQACIWFAVLFCSAKAWAGGEAGGAFGAAFELVRLAQGVAFLEVVHGALGLVRASPVTAFTQWLGRYHVLVCVLGALPELHGSPAVAPMFVVWALADVIRYPWYALQGLGCCPAALTWLRYSAFVVLYPVGVAAEMWLVVEGLPLCEQRGLYRLAMPNRLNFAFHYPTFLRGVLCVYPPAFWSLYSFMLAQRRKKVGKGAKAE